MESGRVMCSDGCLLLHAARGPKAEQGRDGGCPYSGHQGLGTRRHNCEGQRQTHRLQTASAAPRRGGGGVISGRRLLRSQTQAAACCERKHSIRGQVTTRRLQAIVREASETFAGHHTPVPPSSPAAGRADHVQWQAEHCSPASVAVFAFLSFLMSRVCLFPRPLLSFRVARAGSSLCSSSACMLRSCAADTHGDEPCSGHLQEGGMGEWPAAAARDAVASAPAPGPLLGK